MTLTELKALSDACRTDAEFLAHPEVRRMWWKALGKATGHDWSQSGSSGEEYCLRCDIWRPAASELVCCCVPGSLPDAVETLRAKVAEKWNEFEGVCNAVNPFAMALRIVHEGDRLSGEMLYDSYACDTPRDRFLVFAAALAAVETAHG